MLAHLQGTAKSRYRCRRMPTDFAEQVRNRQDRKALICEHAFGSAQEPLFRHRRLGEGTQRVRTAPWLRRRKLLEQRPYILFAIEFVHDRASLTGISPSVFAQHPRVIWKPAGVTAGSQVATNGPPPRRCPATCDRTPVALLERRVRRASTRAVPAAMSIDGTSARAASAGLRVRARALDAPSRSRGQLWKHGDVDDAVQLEPKCVVDKGAKAREERDLSSLNLDWPVVCWVLFHLTISNFSCRARDLGPRLAAPSLGGRVRSRGPMRRRFPDRHCGRAPPLRPSFSSPRSDGLPRDPMGCNPGHGGQPGSWGARAAPPMSNSGHGRAISRPAARLREFVRAAPGYRSRSGR